MPAKGGTQFFKLLGSKAPLGIGRRLQRSNERGGSDSEGGGGQSLGGINSKLPPLPLFEQLCGLCIPLCVREVAGSKCVAPVPCSFVHCC